MTDPASWPSRRVAVLLAGIVGLTTVVLLVVLGIGSEPVFENDGTYYALLGHNLADDGAFSPLAEPPHDGEVFRTPGYPAFLAAIYLLTGGSEYAVRLVHLLLIGGTAIVVGKVAATLFDRRVANVAAVVSVAYIPMVLFGPLHLTEVLASFLLSLTVLATLRAGSARSLARIGWLGLAVGAHAYLVFVRPSVLFTFAVVGLSVLGWSDLSWRRRVALAAAAVCVYAALFTPWMLRNEALTDRLLPLGAGSGTSLYASSEQYAGRMPNLMLKSDFDDLYEHIFRRQREAQRAAVAAGDPHLLSSTQVRLDDQLTEDAWTTFEEVGPTGVLGAIPGRVVRLWAPATIVAALPESMAEPTLLAARLEHTLLGALVAVGLWIERRRLLQRWLLWLPAVVLTATHLVYHVEPRYTLPARPLLFVFAAVGAAQLLDVVRPARPKGGPAPSGA